MTDTWGLDAQMARELLARAERAEAERDRAVELLSVVYFAGGGGTEGKELDPLTARVGSFLAASLSTEESNE
jgi:hypothetical protein